MSNEGYEDQEKTKLIEPQVSYWAHDPRNLHVDVLVVAHQECFDKVKEIYINFDKPIQDYDSCTFPVIENGEIKLKTVEKYKEDYDSLLAKERTVVEAKVKNK